MRSYEKDLTGSRWRGANVGEIRSLSKENLCILFTQNYTFIDFECLWLKRKTERNSHQTLIILRTVMMWVMNRLLEQVWAWMQMFCCLRVRSRELLHLPSLLFMQSFKTGPVFPSALADRSFFMRDRGHCCHTGATRVPGDGPDFTGRSTCVAACLR